MKKLIAVFLFGFTFPFMLFSQSQDYAGQDKLICPGGTTQIGSNAPCAGCCYKWSPSIGLDDPGKPNPIVSGLTESTLYSVTVSLPNGNYEVDYVTVYIYNTTISIFKPRFPYSNPNQPDQMLSETGKKLPGAQTIVNIDNDDCDDLFDNEDDVVTGGDDEFVKIRVTMSIDLPGFVQTLPNILFLSPPTYTAKIDLVSGSDATGIRFWRSNDKSEGSYMLGEELELAPAGATTYEGFIWAEGLEGHTSPQQTKLKASAFGDNSAACNQSDYVSLTVIGINWVKWEGKENGYTGDGKNNSNTLDELADQPVTTNRVFPEGKFVNNTTISAAKTTVTAKVEFSTAPVENLRLYLRALDVDDPSIETAYIDPNDLGTSGTYAGGAGLTYTKDEDNRGIVFFIGNNQLPAQGKFGAFSGTDVYTANNALGIFYKTASANSSTIFVTDFKVSKYPGDNYRIAVYGDLDFLKNLRNEDQYDQHKIVDKCTGGTTDCKEIAQRYTSPTLTNFRTLHIEYDKMRRANTLPADPSSNENQEIKNAYFTDYSVTPNSSGWNDFNVIRDLVGSDGITPLYPDDGSGGNGRFEKGAVRIGNLQFKPKTISAIQMNDDNIICDEYTKPSANGLSCKITKAGLNGIQAIVYSMNRNMTGPKFRVRLTSSFPNLADYNGGQVYLGGTSFPSVLISISGPTSIIEFDLNTIQIPIQIKDDDYIEGLPFEILPYVDNAVKSYLSANIEPVFDGGGTLDNNKDDVNFTINETAPNNVQLYYDIVADSKIIEKDDYWIANLVIGWQPLINNDADPISEEADLGLTPIPPIEYHCEVSDGSDISVILIETIRDVFLGVFPDDPRKLTGYIMAHEIGHQFGLTHGFPEGGNGINDCAPCFSVPCNKIGLMSGGNGFDEPEALKGFHPVHLNLLRSRTKAPKK